VERRPLKIVHSGEPWPVALPLRSPRSADPAPAAVAPGEGNDRKLTDRGLVTAYLVAAVLRRAGRVLWALFQPFPAGKGV